MNEAELIKRYFFRENKDPHIELSIGDDAAIIRPPVNQRLVITTDSMVQGSHFTAQTKPYDIATKLMAVNLSDIAAMGATAKWATLTLTIHTVDEDWLQAFSNGLFEYLDRYQVALIGGDITKGNEINVAIQLIGLVPANKELRRTGANIDDDIYVTGTIGSAAYALQRLLANNHDDASIPEALQLTAKQKNALYAPEPRLDLGVALRDIATSAIDISDGLLHELAILCEHSSLGAHLNLDKLPIEHACDITLALTGGDDYELLFTAPRKHQNKIASIAHDLNCAITCIGTMNKTTHIDMSLHGREFALPKHLGFDHFNQGQDEQ
jgi:thiamine-monophosphate kinase